MKRIFIMMFALTSAITLMAAKPNLWQQQISEKNDTIKLLQQQLDSLQKHVDSLQLLVAFYNDSLSIYNFFNNTDVSIFSDLSLENKVLVGKTKINYETIRRIAVVESKLNEIESTIEQAKQQKLQNQWSDADLKNYIRLTIKADMNEIGQELDVIDKLDLSFLSMGQNEYYKKQSERFDKIYNRYL